MDEVVWEVTRPFTFTVTELVELSGVSVVWVTVLLDLLRVVVETVSFPAMSVDLTTEMVPEARPVSWVLEMDVVVAVPELSVAYTRCVFTCQ